MNIVSLPILDKLCINFPVLIDCIVKKHDHIPISSLYLVKLNYYLTSKWINCLFFVRYNIKKCINEILSNILRDIVNMAGETSIIVWCHTLSNHIYCINNQRWKRVLLTTWKNSTTADYLQVLAIWFPAHSNQYQLIVVLPLWPVYSLFSTIYFYIVDLTLNGLSSSQINSNVHFLVNIFIIVNDKATS